mmetsp:Transcript_4600/g.15036  ORF Transcript_4600/g.15036 Transcript_4600/m.15036 type:complete len:221 (-) Transcript_4600:485-1147(-)
MNDNAQDSGAMTNANAKPIKCPHRKTPVMMNTVAGKWHSSARQNPTHHRSTPKMPALSMASCTCAGLIASTSGAPCIHTYLPVPANAIATPIAKPISILRLRTFLCFEPDADAAAIFDAERWCCAPTLDVDVAPTSNDDEDDPDPDPRRVFASSRSDSGASTTVAPMVTPTRRRRWRSRARECGGRTRAGRRPRTRGYRRAEVYSSVIDSRHATTSWRRA